MYFNVSVRAVVDPEYSVKREEVIIFYFILLISCHMLLNNSYCLVDNTTCNII